MRHLLNIILIIFVSSWFGTTLFAQGDSAVVSEIRTYITHIDSLHKLDHPQNFGYMTSIADGIIKRDDVTIGGFGIYTLSNAKGDTALRIEYHDNVDINIYKIYYYKTDKLIYATVELQDGRRNMKSIYRKEEFYNDGAIVFTTMQKDKRANRYFDKINFSMYEDGLKYLSDFKQQNRR